MTLNLRSLRSVLVTWACVFTLSCAASKRGGSALTVQRPPNPSPPEESSLLVVAHVDGFTAFETETRLTKPLERALGEVSNASVDSATVPGLVVLAPQHQGSLGVTRSDARCAVNGAPLDLDHPATAVLQVLGVVASYALASGRLTATELSRLNDEQVLPALRRVPGVAATSVCGHSHDVVWLEADPAPMQALGINVAQLVRLKDRPELHSSKSAATAFDDLPGMSIAAVNGQPVRVRDVATVSSRPAPMSCRATRDGYPVIAGTVWLGHGFDATSVRAALREALSGLQADLPTGTRLTLRSDNAVHVHGLDGHDSFRSSPESFATVVSEALGSLEGVEHIGTWFGVTTGDVPIGSARSFGIDVELTPGTAPTEARIAEVEARLARVSTLTTAVVPRPALHEVRVRITGPELQQLKEMNEAAGVAARSLSQVRGVLPVGDSDATRPALRVEPDHDKVAALGSAASDVDAQLAVATEGFRLGSCGSGEDRTDVLIHLSNPSSAMSGRLFVLESRGHAPVPLTDVARLELTASPAFILHRDSLRATELAVFAGDGGALLTALRNTLSTRVELPPGYRVEVRERASAGPPEPWAPWTLAVGK